MPAWQIDRMATASGAADPRHAKLPRANRGKERKLSFTPRETSWTADSRWRRNKPADI